MVSMKCKKCFQNEILYTGKSYDTVHFFEFSQLSAKYLTDFLTSLNPWTYSLKNISPWDTDETLLFLNKK